MTSLSRLFARYVSLNILGMLGISCYVIADTFFIALASGADGITVLNLCLPIYNLIYALGAMIGIGSAIRYVTDNRDGHRDDRIFFNALIWSLLIGTILGSAGFLNAASILELMGGDAGIVALGIPYLQYFIPFMPFFMINYAVPAFIRNDGAPGLAMGATLASCLFNIVFDYIFMFPLGMGIAGAALATGLAPIVSILCCSVHFFGKTNHIRFVPCLPNPKLLFRSCQVGVSSFVGEIAAGITTATFNFLILDLAGNIGVAAYGVIANFAIVGTAIFNGLAQGTQPLVSLYYAENNRPLIRWLYVMGVGTGLTIASLLYAAVLGFTPELVALFNSEQSAELAALAFTGMHIYFIGFFFSSLNIFLASSMSAENRPFPAAVISVSRGIITIILCAVILAHFFGMTGIWAAYPVCEALTLILGLACMKLGGRSK